MRATIISLTATAALALGACGGGDDSSSASGSSASSGRDKAMDGALKFARCMREQGLDFPDPRVGSDGVIKIAAGTRLDPDDPKLQSAQRKCGRHLEQGGGEARDPALESRLQDAFVDYARCMRREGVEMPDPKPGGGLTFRVGDPNAPNPESPAFKAADRKCHGHLAEADKAIQAERSR